MDASRDLSHAVGAQQGAAREAIVDELLAALEATTGICAFVLTKNICDDHASQLIMAAVEAAEAAIARATTPEPTA